MTAAKIPRSRGGPWRSDHQPLSLFNLSRVKSRIPILVHKSRLETVQTNDATSLPLFKPKNHHVQASGNSKIPVCKTYLQDSSQNTADITRMDLTEEKQGYKGKRHFKYSFDKPMNTKPPKTIKLRGLELVAINFEVFENSDVEALYLSPEREACLDYKLPFLPSSVGKLANLKVLVVDTNELQEIPEEISNLQKLETLVLSNNDLIDLPAGLADLHQLKSLHLANNKFDHVPSVICQLNQLGFLDMSDNQLRGLPLTIANLSASLHTLLLLMNQIEILPPTFSMLTSLICLWLGENNLTTLPDDFGELFRLDWGERPCSSNIEKNPLVHPPVEICQLGPLAIRQYFHTLKQENN